MNMKNQDIVITGCARTAVGDFGGGLSSLSSSQLAEIVMREAISRSNLENDQIEKVIFGNNFSTLEHNVGRNAAIKIGIPVEVPAYNINSTCGSSIQSIISAAQSVRDGEAEVILAGGTESMSNIPYVLEGARWGQKIRHGRMTDALWKAMQEPAVGVGMGLTAENLAEKYDISREEQDAFALLSHQRAVEATEKGLFQQEIVPVEIRKRKGKTAIVDKDEHPRADVTLEQLSKLRPAFKENGTVTAGNACSVNDGAAAAIVMNGRKAKELGIGPMAKFLGYATVGVAPNYMGYGPVPAVKKLMERTGLQIRDIHRVEMNEAFASQYLVCERELGLDRETTNPNGNGIAIGHPVGATGCRLVTTLLYGLRRDQKEIGVATLCAGGGMGLALAFQML
ncbi:acetyl-CoA C-acetyltransferase [delta proteobacterium NaphS2]|nr:acetyl-CoA C-acetyltransferase [delta proteobacterium NaphS2]